jgi:hypothetical protein
METEFEGGADDSYLSDVYKSNSDMELDSPGPLPHKLPSPESLPTQEPS